MYKNREKLESLIQYIDIFLPHVPVDALKKSEDILYDLIEKYNTPISTIETILPSTIGVNFIDVRELKDYDEQLIRKYRELLHENILPIKDTGKEIVIAVADPTDPNLVKKVRFRVKKPVKILAACPTHLKKKIEELNNNLSSIKEEVLSKISEKENEEITTPTTSAIKIDFEEEESDSAVNKLFKLIIAEAINKKASDIHIEPFENYVRIRYRIDGILQIPKGLDKLPVQLKNQLTTKFKLAAGMNIAEKRVPQDGRIRVELKDRVIDFRVSCLPVIHGEKIVLRMLDKSNLQLELEKLGFEDREYNLITKAIRQPYGMILVTGPTGSGKTTTLYSCLMKVNSPQVNITTAEDPVEYSIEGINQVQINPQVGLTFAEALKAFLRQDPDIILVGEIRDKETAEIGIESALTGHLVLSTLHTNDSVAAITRLEDMGIEKFLISSSVILVVAQRLARKICPKCKEPYQYPEEALKEVGFSEKEISYLKTYKGKGCDYCNGTGYKGRIALYEVFEITPEIKDMIIRGKSEEEIRKKAIENGLRTLREIGKIKIAKGVTTPEEVLRVTR